MKKNHIESTSQNKKNQKSSVFYSSSAIFFVNHNPAMGIETEVSILNHFLLKRGIKRVDATFYLRNLKGELISTERIAILEPKTYTFNPCKNISGSFIGSIYIEFSSKENLAVPFCAVVGAVKTGGSVCAVHTYGRRLEKEEIGTQIDLIGTKEMGWTLRDSDAITSFALFHNGGIKSKMNFKIEVQNYRGSIITNEVECELDAYATILLYPKKIFSNVVDFLDGKLGHAKVSISGLKGIFPRMLCGNFLDRDFSRLDINYSSEIQFTHSNFDFGTMVQPDSIGDIGYFNHPYLPHGYGIYYPIETLKKIKVGEDLYKSNQLYKFEIASFSQTNVECLNGSLPSRFVGASVGQWPNSQVESECSTGTYTKDYLENICHWHWGLMKPSFVEGKGIISIHSNSFEDSPKDVRNLKLRVFHDGGLLLERGLIYKSSAVIDDIDFSRSKGSVWYALSGDHLEDLNIFATFIPKNRSGFCEHAF